MSPGRPLLRSVRMTPLMVCVCVYVSVCICWLILILILIWVEFHTQAYRKRFWKRVLPKLIFPSAAPCPSVRSELVLVIHCIVLVLVISVLSHCTGCAAPCPSVRPQILILVIHSIVLVLVISVLSHSTGCAAPCPSVRWTILILNTSTNNMYI